MNPVQAVQTVGTAAFTGDDSKTGLFIGIMVVMAVIIIGLIVFSVISSKKNADKEEKTGGKDDRKDSGK